MRPTFHTLKAVSEQTGLSKQTIWRYVSTGRLKAFKFNGTAWRVSDEELQRFLATAKSNGEAA